MNGISLEQLSLRSYFSLFNLKPAKNILIDFYLDGFKRREKNKEKLLILLINYITILSYILCIVKYVAGFNKLSYTTKLILFDVSSLVGGIELYNRILLLLGLIAGLANHLTLRWTKCVRHREWIQMFELARGKIPQQLVIARSQIEIQIKLNKAMKLVCKMVTILWILLSKLFFNYYSPEIVSC